MGRNENERIRVFSMRANFILILAAFLLQPVVVMNSYGSDESVEILEVRKALVNSQKESCTDYILTVLDEKFNLVDINLCLKGGRGKDVPAVWVIDKGRKRVIGQFHLYMYFLDGKAEKVVEFRTNEYSLSPSQFLAIKMPLYVDENGEEKCITNGYGIVSLKVFMEYWESRSKLSGHENLKKVRQQLVDGQPWCQE